MVQPSQESPYSSDTLVPQHPPIISTTIYRPSRGPPDEDTTSIGAYVTYGGEFVPDRPDDPRQAKLRKHYEDLCGDENSLPLTALAIFDKNDVSGRESFESEPRQYSFPLPPRSFEETNLPPANSIVFDINDMAMGRIASLCKEQHTLYARELYDFLIKQHDFTHMLINDTTHRVCRGQHMHPDDFNEERWVVHPCLNDPIREFHLRAPKGNPTHMRGELIAAVDWTVPKNKIYLVDGSKMRLHLGLRRVYYQDCWLVIIEKFRFEIPKDARGIEITIKDRED